LVFQLFKTCGGSTPLVSAGTTCGTHCAKIDPSSHRDINN
jgi:hypothetical protein